MKLYWGDPDDALARMESDQEAFEKECPICDYCGDAITDGTYTEIEWGVRLGRYHNECAGDFIHIQSVDDYIRDRRAMQC